MFEGKTENLDVMDKPVEPVINRRDIRNLPNFRTIKDVRDGIGMAVFSVRPFFVQLKNKNVPAVPYFSNFRDEMPEFGPLKELVLSEPEVCENDDTNNAESMDLERKMKLELIDLIQKKIGIMINEELMTELLALERRSLLSIISLISSEFKLFKKKSGKLTPDVRMQILRRLIENQKTYREHEEFLNFLKTENGIDVLSVGENHVEKFQSTYFERYRHLLKSGLHVGMKIRSWKEGEDGRAVVLKRISDDCRLLFIYADTGKVADYICPQELSNFEIFEKKIEAQPCVESEPVAEIQSFAAANLVDSLPFQKIGKKEDVQIDMRIKKRIEIIVSFLSEELSVEPAYCRLYEGEEANDEGVFDAFRLIFVPEFGIAIFLSNKNRNFTKIIGGVRDIDEESFSVKNLLLNATIVSDVAWNDDMQKWKETFMKEFDRVVFGASDFDYKKEDNDRDSQGAFTPDEHSEGPKDLAKKTSRVAGLMSKNEIQARLARLGFNRIRNGKGDHIHYYNDRNQRVTIMAYGAYVGLVTSNLKRLGIDPNLFFEQ